MEGRRKGTVDKAAEKVSEEGHDKGEGHILAWGRGERVKWKKEEEDEEKEQKERKKKNRGADESVYDSQKLVDCCDNGI